MREAARFVAVCLWGAGLAALPSQAQEQVRIQVPDSVIFEILELKARTTAPVSRLSFEHALLAPGSRLRISVRVETDLAATDTSARIRFTAANPRGGTAFSGPLRPDDYTPVFESSPLALAGSVELAWTMESVGRFSRAGSREVVLRWKAEAIPGAAPLQGGGGSPPGRGVPTLETLPSTGSDLRARGRLGTERPYPPLAKKSPAGGRDHP